MRQPIDLDPIKALCAAATPGPWCLASRGGEQSHDSVWPVDLNAEQRIAVIENTDDHSGDARLIAESRAMVPALVAEIERLRADLADRELALAMARGEGWPENTEAAAVYALVPVAHVCLNETAHRGDGTEAGEICEQRGFDFMAEAKIVRADTGGAR